MFTIRPLPSVSMSRARSSDVIDSSRQIGVWRRRCSSACRTRSSHASGCSIIISPSSSSSAQPVDVVERVGVVGVGHERRGRAGGFASSAHELHVGAGHDLDLHLAITCLERCADPLRKCVGDFWMPSEMPTSISCRVPPSNRESGMPSCVASRPQIAHLDCCLRHEVAANVLVEQRQDVARECRSSCR